MENCTFHPRVIKDVKFEGRREEGDQKKAFHERFGLNFKNSVPAIFKAGVLR